jgi:hypothetical protein
VQHEETNKKTTCRYIVNVRERRKKYLPAAGTITIKVEI